MADRGRGAYRGGGRGGRRGNYRAHPYSKGSFANISRDHDRSRDSPRESRDRDRNDRSDRPRYDRNERDRSRDRGDRHRADDRDRIHKPSRGGPRSNNAGLGHNDRSSRTQRASAERDTHERQPPSGPRDPNARFRPGAPGVKPEDDVKVKTDADVNTKMDEDDDELSDSERMARIMGFKKFKTTKNTKIPGNEYNYAVRKEKQTQYRQYMNRQGGFNRPLSPSRG